MHDITAVPADYTPHQGNDGTSYVTYYDNERQFSFVWDGVDDFIEISHGGHAEPVTHLAPAPELGTTVPGFCGYVQRHLLGLAA